MKAILASILLAFIGITHAQEVSFPNNALGVYKGTLKIYMDNGNKELPMKLELKATSKADTYDYIIVYGDAENKSEHSYSIVRTGNPNRFKLDENNGIILDYYMSEDVLYNTFEVNQSILTTRIAIMADGIDWSITSASKKNTIKTESDEEDPTIVSSYPVSTTQRAFLIKQ